MKILKRVDKKKKQMHVCIGKATNLTLGHGLTGAEHNTRYWYHIGAYANKKSY